MPQIFSATTNALQLCLELSGTSQPMQETRPKANPFELQHDIEKESVSSCQEAYEHGSSDIKYVFPRAATSQDKELNYMLSSLYSDPLEDYIGPTVRLFNKSDAMDALEKAQMCDPETCARITKVIKTLVAHGELRKLAQLQDDFHYALRCLLDKYEQFREVVEYVVSCATIARHRGDGVLRMSPLLLVGEPGLGKTEFLTEFSALLKVGFKKIDLSTSQCNSELAGSSSFWVNSAPSKIFLMAAQGPYGECVGNPVILLDEIDKPAQSAGFTNGDPLGVLHTLLERHSATTFVDLAIDIPIDVSNYLFFATCNDADLVPRTLRSRFREFTITVSKDQMRRIAISITHELLNELSGSNITFHPMTIDALSELESPRLIKSHAFDALGRALTGDRDIVRPSDLKAKASTKHKMGFV